MKSKKELDKIEAYIAEGRDEKFIINCLQAVGATLTDVAPAGYVNIVKFMIAHGADVNYKKAWAMRWACYNGQSEVVRELIAAGADVDAKVGLPLERASMKGHIEIVKLLLAGGANPFDYYNNRALQMAHSNGHSEVVKLLEEAMEDIRKKLRMSDTLQGRIERIS